MNKILISGIGGDLGQSIATIVKQEYPGCEIFGIDSSDRHAGQFFCNHLSLSPLANDAGYMPYIENLILTHKIDLFIPSTEHELRQILKSTNKTITDKVISCDVDSLEKCLDKLTTFQFLSSKGLKTPWFTKYANEVKSFPCIYKDRTSSGSRSIFTVNTAAEADFYSKTYTNGLFQELLPDSENEYTCSIFCGKDKKIHILILVRKLTGGATSWCQVRQNKEIHDYCTDIVLALKSVGSINIQLRLTKNGPLLFEINPRFSSTVLMRHLVGFSDVKWSIDDMLNTPSHSTYHPVKTGTTIVKTSNIIKYTT